MARERFTPQARLSSRERLAIYFLGTLVVAGLGFSYYRIHIASPPVQLLEQTGFEPGGVDINRADWWELDLLLPGVGETIARRIVEYREIHGPFQSVDELIEVQGIGPATLEGIKPYVKVETVPRGTFRPVVSETAEGETEPVSTSENPPYGGLADAEESASMRKEGER